MTGAIRPGHPWLDTNNQRIHAHGGSIIVVGDTYYWYGENKEHSSPDNGVWHWGVRCYSSTDLYRWEDRGLIIPPQPDDPEHPFHPSQQMDRPHIIFNHRTGLFVCWVKIMSSGATQSATILTANHVLGPYTIVRTDLQPLGMNAGDFDLTIEPSDGKAYYYFDRAHSELICADLTTDYTDVSGYYSTHFPLVRPPFVREAPAHFRRNGLHYLITSGTTGYFPNQSEVALAPTFHGPWRNAGNPHPDDGTNTSFNSQISSVFRHPARRDLYIALADRWVPHPTHDSSNVHSDFERAFHPDHRGNPAELLPKDPDTSVADYVWLPIEFDNDVPYIRWRDEWRIEDFE